MVHVIGFILKMMISGKTWREQVGREVGGGIGMGKTCEPKTFSFQCMTEFTTNKKKKNDDPNPPKEIHDVLIGCDPHFEKCLYING